MRLLAHGGNEYAERRRIGSWPSIATGPLEDTYGLSGDLLSFGCGLLENQPILIIRQAQKQGQRLYAYSLLLDPGLEVWEKFQWNGASLLIALFDAVKPAEAAPDCLGRRLLERPEEMDEEKLVSLFERLTIPAIGPPRDSANLNSLWVGAVCSPEPVTVAPKSVGMDSRPGAGQLASALQGLHPCFRAGLGWLVGGSAIHSRTFGTHLVIDDWLTQDAQPAQEHIKKGAWIRSAWETLTRNKSVGPVLREKSTTPIWRWDESWASSPARTFDRVGRLATLLVTNSVDEHLISSVEDSLDEPGPLETEIRQAVHSLVLSSRGDFGRALTIFLLRGHFNEGLTLNAATAARLDTPTVVEFFADERRRIRPSSEKSPLLSAEVRFEIWLNLISTETNAAELPGLLYGANNDLESHHSLRPRFGEIILESLDRSLALTNSLDVWIAHRRHKILGPLIGASLREESCQRVIKEAGHWQRVYLAFGDDPGGRHLAQLDIPAQSAQTLVREIAKLSKLDDGLSLDARIWLSELARSPLRNEIPVIDKIQLRECEGWEGFQAMMQLYLGNHSASARARANERDALIRELGELTTVRFNYDFVPNLRGLISFLGRLSDDTISALASLRPKMMEMDITEWMEGWEKLSPRGVYQDELVRQIMHSERQFQVPALLNKLDVHEKRTRLFRELFCGDTSLSDEEIFKVCERFIEHARAKDSSLKGRITAAFKDCEADQSKMNIFFRRYCNSANFLDRLFKCLDEDSRQHIVTIIFRLDYEGLEIYACRYYRESEKLNFEFTLFKQTVLWFALTDQGKPLREAIVKDQGYKKTSYVEKRLKELLGPYAARGTQELRSKTKPWWRSLF